MAVLLDRLQVGKDWVVGQINRVYEPMIRPYGRMAARAGYVATVAAVTLLALRTIFLLLPKAALGIVVKTGFLAALAIDIFVALWQNVRGNQYLPFLNLNNTVLWRSVVQINNQLLA